MIKTPAYVHFIQPGFLTTVQDWARYSMVPWGVPYSGVMDRISMTLVNFLLGNHENAAVLEMTHTGPEMVFDMPTRIAFAGADADIYLNGKPIKKGEVIQIEEEDRILVKRFRKHQWLYMGIQGGFESEMVGKSRSWYPGITPRHRMEKGESLCYFYEERYFPPVKPSSKIKANWYKKSEILAFPGPEWNQLPKLLQNRILKKSFTVSDLVNRMAYQLEELIDNNIAPILTSPVYPGTVQLTPSGQLIILMRDAQVTGGYPRILMLENNSLSILSQKTPGSKINFKLTQN